MSPHLTVVVPTAVKGSCYIANNNVLAAGAVKELYIHIEEKPVKS